VPTTGLRGDVNRVLGVTGNHGFGWTVPQQYRSGTRVVHVFARDSGGGTSRELMWPPRTMVY
jgi:hypothetical protein